MAQYIPNTWAAGDVVTKTKLDRLEAGVAAAYGAPTTLGSLMRPFRHGTGLTDQIDTVTVSGVAPTFTNISYAATGANLPKFVTLSGGPYTYDYDAYWRNNGMRLDTSPAGMMSMIFDGDHLDVQASSFAAGDFLIYIDGQLWNELPIGHAITFGNVVYLDIHFVDDRERRVDIVAGSPSFVGVHFEQGATVYPAPVSDFKVAIVGDSFVGGATKPAQNGDQFVQGAAMPHWLREATSWDVCPAGIGGTGWEAPDADSRFGATERLNGLVRTNPDLAIFYGSINDPDSGTLTATVTSTLAAVAALLPDLPVVVVGAEPNGPGFAQYDSVNSKIKAGALAAPNCLAFLDQRSPQNWFQLSGNGYLTADGLHPRVDGDRYLGYRLARALAPILLP